MLRSCGFQFWRVARSPPGSDRQRAYINLCCSCGRTIPRTEPLFIQESTPMPGRKRRRAACAASDPSIGTEVRRRSVAVATPFVVEADTHDVVRDAAVEVRGGDAGERERDGLLQFAEVH